MGDTVFEPEVRRSLTWVQDVRPLLPIAMECKKTELAYLPFAKVQDHQVQGLQDFEQKGHVEKLRVAAVKGRAFMGDRPFDFVTVPKGHGYLLVNFRFTRKAPRKDLKKGTNRCFAVRVDAYVEAKAQLELAGRSSLPIEWFEENALELVRLRKNSEKGNAESGWDLCPLV